MTNQEAFDTVVVHLKNQGWERSVNEYGSCAYRGKNGLKCAVGALIPDEEYNPDWDVNNGDYIEDVQNECPALQDLNILLLRDLQLFHDDSFIGDPNRRFMQMKQIAHDYNLEFNYDEEFFES